jgi:hypothetical protein
MSTFDWTTAPDVFTIPEAAEILRCSYNAVRILCHSKDKGFPAMRIGRAWAISAVGLRAWIKNLSNSPGHRAAPLLPAGKLSCLPGGAPKSNATQLSEFVAERKS